VKKQIFYGFGTNPAVYTPELALFALRLMFSKRVVDCGNAAMEVAD